MKKVRVVTARAHRLRAPMIDEIGRLHAKGEPCVILVPEQLTLEMERELLSRLKLEGFFTLQVFSPSRLSERVLDAAGKDGRMPLSAPGRLMAVKYAALKCEGALTYYKASAQRRGFPQKAASLITDMKQGGLTHESLREYALSLPEGARREKLTDISKLYEAYQRVLGDRFSDDEDMLSYVASRLDKSGLLRGQHMFVYGFDSLPEQLSLLLAHAASVCESLCVALICDEGSAPDGDIYEPIRSSVTRFSRRITERGMECAWERLQAAPLSCAPPIRYIDEALFTYGYEKYEGENDSVFLFSENSPFEEATLASRQILRLMDGGMDPDDIALLYPDDNGYAFSVYSALSISGIPFYTDEKMPAIAHGLSRFLLCALRAASEGFRNEDVFGMLKSGYSPLTYREGCRLQGYALACGIRKARWLSRFEKGGEQEAAEMEELRQRLISPLVRLREGIVAARDTRSSLEAVFSLLTEVKAYDTLRSEEEKLLEGGMTARASQNSQMWSAVMDVLNQLYALMDGARTPLKHIAAWMESGLSAVTLASLPPASHMLHTGLLGHSLSGSKKAVFVLGLSDGVLSKSAESLLPDDERRDMQSATGAYLGVTDESRALMARLDLKRAMTLPTETLFLSFSKTAPDGTALRPLGLLSIMRERMFKELPASPVPTCGLPRSGMQALSGLGPVLRAYADGGGGPSALPEKWESYLAELLYDSELSKATDLVLRAAGKETGSGYISSSRARELYGGEALSVSRLELFADCPFRHFITYGLKPRVIKEWKPEPIDTGLFYHASLSAFAQLAAKDRGFPDISDESAISLIDEAMSPLLAELYEGPLGDGARSQSLFLRAQETVRRAAVTIKRHLAAGSFRIERAEAAFGYPGGLPPLVLALDDGREIMLRGRIDRVDRYSDGKSVYLRVIDYKSSRHDIDAAKTWWGLQLQLLLYLEASLSIAENSVPAGAFYFYVGDPLVESEQDIREAAEEKLRDLLTLRGITLADVEVISAMDEAGSVALPRMLDKNGDIKKDAKALDIRQMRALLAHSKSVASMLAARMQGGEIAPLPTKAGGRIACDDCDYRSICGFEPNARDARFSEIPGMTMDDIRRSLDEGGNFS